MAGQLDRLAIRPCSCERPDPNDESQVTCFKDPRDLEIERALHRGESSQRCTDARQAMSEAPWLRRKRGTRLIQGHERVKVAAVDSVNDRPEDFLRRSLA